MLRRRWGAICAIVRDRLDGVVDALKAQDLEAPMLLAQEARRAWMSDDGDPS
jgi:hypothetical protein